MSENIGEGQGWEQILRSIVGDQAAEEIIETLRSQGIDPSTVDLGSDISSDPSKMMSMMSHMNQVLSGTSGPLNWDLALDLARQGANQGTDPILTAAQAANLRQALSVADLWLDTATELSPPKAEREAWTRTQWVEHTMPVWRRICEPVAANAAKAMGEAMSAQMESHEFGSIPDLGGLMQGLNPQEMVQRLCAAVFGMQIGQAVGNLAREAFGSTDAGIPLVDTPMTALVGANVDDFGEGLDVPSEEVTQFLAVREAAHARLFNSVPWLRSHLLDAVESYSREITLDLGAIEDAARNMESFDPNQLQQAAATGIFSPTPSPAQAKALERLEVTLAVIEGWVEEVTTAATLANLSHAFPLREMMRRRRSTGSPAEQLLASLIGLEFRPRRARDAATLWQSLADEGGIAERDRLWSHPDIMPSSEELDNPTEFLAMRKKAAEDDQDVDNALASLLDGSLGWAEGIGPETDGTTDPTSEASDPEADPEADQPEDRESGSDDPV